MDGSGFPPRQSGLNRAVAEPHVRIGNDTNNNFGYEMNLSAITNYVISQ